VEEQLPVVRAPEYEKKLYMSYELPNMNVQLPVVTATESEIHFTCRKTSRM
jgi:hypothetical protein